MRENARRGITWIGVLAACFFGAAAQLQAADPSQFNYCTDSADSLTALRDSSFSLGNGWVLTADNFGACRKKDDPEVGSIVVARGNVKIRKNDKPAILSVDYSDMRVNELDTVAVTVELDHHDKVKVVAPNYSGVGMQLYASNIIKHGGSSETSEIALISDFPWRFYPGKNDSNLVLYPAFFRPVLTGISDGTFGWTGSFADALAHEFEEGSLNLSIPFTMTGSEISTVSGDEPVLLFNIGSWFGKTFGLPLESVPVVLSQESGQSHADAHFDVNDVLGGIPGELLGVFSHRGTIKKVFKTVSSKDELKLASKKAITWSDEKIVKYAGSKLSPLPDKHRTKFLEDIEKSKSQEPENTGKLLKALGAFLTVIDNSEVDYDFISQDVALNPLFVQLGISELGDFKGNIYAGFSKKGDPAWYFIDTLGLDVTIPYELTEATAVPFFGLEKIPLPENPFQIGLGVVELGGKISGMADPLFDVFHLAGKGGKAVDYSKWKVDAETEGTMALVDSLSLLASTQSVSLPWPLKLKTTMDFKLGNQNGIAGTGTISLFDIITGTGSAHFFIGNNAKPVDVQMGLSTSLLGAHTDGTLGGFFDRQGNFHLKMKEKVSYKVFGHSIGSVPLEMEFIVDDSAAELKAGIHWSNHGCVWGHCVVHSGSKTIKHVIPFNSSAEMLTEVTTAYGDETIYAAAEPNQAGHTFSVDSGNQRVTVSAKTDQDDYPVFSVTGPDGASYVLNSDLSSDLPVIDLNSEDYEIQPFSASGQSTDTAYETAFLVGLDEEGGTTLLVIEDPQPGEYTVTPAEQSVPVNGLAAHATPEMLILAAAAAYPQSIEISEALTETFSVELQSSNTPADSKVAIYARPRTSRNATYDQWHEKQFNASSTPSDRQHLSDQGDFVYQTDWDAEASSETLGYLQATNHGFERVITPETDLVHISEELTHEKATTLQRNASSVKLGEYVISRDGIHELEVQIGAYEIYNGQYQLIARYEDRNDAPYVDLPYTLTVKNDPPLLPKPTITSVRGTEDGKAEIEWRSNASASEIAKVRVFLHDHAKGASDEVYTTFWDFNPDDPIQISGLARDKAYSFSMALLKEVSTEAYGKTHTLHEPGRRSETVAFRPYGPDFVGAPCVKLVDSESYASFEPNGDLFVRLRILNESETGMSRAPVRIYYNHRNEENLLAAAGATQEGMSYSDVHFTIPFEHMTGLETPKDDPPSIVYDIDTGDQDEHLTYDNAGVMKIENVEDFRDAKNNFFDTTVVLNLKKGWNLVGDAVGGEDVFGEFTHGTIYSHDGTQMRENVPNRQFGGGYFVYLPRDTNIVLTGTPVEPDFSRAGDNNWQLLGTGVDIYNSLADGEAVPSDSSTYTPGNECDCVYGLQRNSEGAIQWEKNPAIIEAGSGFWCVKE